MTPILLPGKINKYNKLKRVNLIVNTLLLLFMALLTDKFCFKQNLIKYIPMSMLLIQLLINNLIINSLMLWLFKINKNFLIKN